MNEKDLVKTLLFLERSKILKKEYKISKSRYYKELRKMIEESTEMIETQLNSGNYRISIYLKAGGVRLLYDYLKANKFDKMKKDKESFRNFGYPGLLIEKNFKLLRTLIDNKLNPPMTFWDYRQRDNSITLTNTRPFQMLYFKKGIGTFQSPKRVNLIIEERIDEFVNYNINQLKEMKII